VTYIYYKFLKHVSNFRYWNGETIKFLETYNLMDDRVE
jgi:hypothetical protein